MIPADPLANPTAGQTQKMAKPSAGERQELNCLPLARRSKSSDPNEIRTRVAGVRGRRPKPLDDGAMGPRLLVPKSATLGDQDSNLDSKNQNLASCH